MVSSLAISLLGPKPVVYRCHSAVHCLPLLSMQQKALTTSVQLLSQRWHKFSYCVMLVFQVEMHILCKLFQGQTAVMAAVNQHNLLSFLVQAGILLLRPLIRLTVEP